MAWIPFRAQSLGDAGSYISGIVSRSLFSAPEILPNTVLAQIVLLVLVEWTQRFKQHGLHFDPDTTVSRPWRWAIYAVLLLQVLANFTSQREFIYFQF